MDFMNYNGSTLKVSLYFCAFKEKKKKKNSDVVRIECLKLGVKNTLSG